MGLKRNFFSRAILYPTIGILTYLISKSFFPTEAEKAERERLKNFPKIIQDPIHINPEPIDIRGGFQSKEFFQKLFENNFKHIFMSVLAICGVAVGDRFRLVLTEIFKGASPAITALPLPFARRLLEGLYNLNPSEILGTLKQGLLSKELTLEEKLKLLKQSLHALIISAKTIRLRRSLLLTALMLLVGTVLTSGPLFGGAMLVFQDIFTKAVLKRGTVDFILSIYREYNAPIPSELYELMEEVSLINVTTCNL